MQQPVIGGPLTRTVHLEEEEEGFSARGAEGRSEEGGGRETILREREEERTKT